MIKVGDTLRLSPRGRGPDGERYRDMRGWDKHSLFIAMSVPDRCDGDEDALLAVFSLDSLSLVPSRHFVWRFEVVDEGR